MINRHHFRGRKMPEPWTYIGRGTPLGNPFTVREHGEGALELYRRHLWDRVRSWDLAIVGALRSITPEHHLVCSCAPRPCHGDVVVACWRWLFEGRSSGILLRIDGGSFCAGIVIADGKVETAAPILRWAIGRNAEDVEQSATKRGWKMVLCP